jgi:small subunit ribosomal protein S6
MNKYETVFILTPVLSEDQAKEAVGKFRKIIKDLGANIIHEESWGLRKMAYQIQKKSTGHYYLIEFHGGNNAVAELELAFKRDERILRFMTVALDKHAAAYSEKRRNRAKEKKKEKETA